MALPLYIASLLGAIGLILALPGTRATAVTNASRLRHLLGLVVFAALPGLVWVAAARFWLLNGDAAPSGLDSGAWPFYFVFSAISLIAAVRVITHPKPVYAALWFVLVVLASSGLFLTLSAEFIAFAVILIYAGAILVTYMFVIMLASQSGPKGMLESPEYERVSREPLAAVAAGFLLLAVMLSVVFDQSDIQPNPQAAAMSDQELYSQVLGDRVDAESRVEGRLETGVSVSNSERLGVDLFRSNPLGLELAGIVLLVALVGAVVIARTRVDDEDEIIHGDGSDTDAAARGVDPLKAEGLPGA